MKSVVLLSFSVLFAAPALQARPVRWDFPRPQPQEGIPFADSKTGVLVWNGDGALDITVGRGDWWEHRGGTPWLPSQSYTNIVSLVKRGELDPQTGLGRIRLEKGGKTYEAELAMSFRTGVFAIRWPEGLVPRAKAIAAWDSTIGIETKPRVQARLKTLGYAPPSYRGNGDGLSGGFTQTLPNGDAPGSLDFVTRGGETLLATARCESAAITAKSFAEVREDALSLLAERPDGSPRHGRRGSKPLNGRDCGQGPRSRAIRLAGRREFQQCVRLETSRSRQPNENSMKWANTGGGAD